MDFTVSAQMLEKAEGLDRSAAKGRIGELEGQEEDTHSGRNREPVLRLAGALLANDKGYGPDEDLEIPSDRVMTHVRQVVPHLLVVRDVRTSVDLCEAGHPGLYFVTLAKLFRPGGDNLRHIRPRADKAHVAPNDVQELRQFVDCRLAQGPADSSRVARPAARTEQAPGQISERQAIEHIGLSFEMVHR